MNNGQGHSSQVRGWLETNGPRFSLSQVGPDFCILRTSAAIPPTEADLVVEIDGNKHRQRVYLASGISAASTRVELSKK